MKKKEKKYADLIDLLPSPKELAYSSSKQKITIEFEEEDIKFFKSQAKKYKASYQQMIRNLVSQYADKFRNAAPN